MSSFDDEPLPPGVNPDDNKSDDENDFVSIPAPPGEEASNAPPGVIRRSDSPYSLGDSLSEPESDDGLVAPGLGDDLLPPGVEETDAPPAPPPIPPPPKFVLDDELCKKLAQRKVSLLFSIMKISYSVRMRHLPFLSEEIMFIQTESVRLIPRRYDSQCCKKQWFSIFL